MRGPAPRVATARPVAASHTWTWSSHFTARSRPDERSEQSALVHLLYREPKDKWKCVGQRAFNSYLYELYPGLYCPEGQYQAGDFIIHLPGVANERKLPILRRFLEGASM